MEGLELACFQIISKAGASKSQCFEALKLARNKEFEKAKEKIKESKNLFLEAHEVHREFISKEAEGADIKITLLLVHAEDQLMSTETTRELILEMIQMYEQNNSK
ncbi:MAG: PTS lactose/cellobiose transporter subunit IIA [Lactovum sp.]